MRYRYSCLYMFYYQKNEMPNLEHLNQKRISVLKGYLIFIDDPVCFTELIRGSSVIIIVLSFDF